MRNALPVFDGVELVIFADPQSLGVLRNKRRVRLAPVLLELVAGHSLLAPEVEDEFERHLLFAGRGRRRIHRRAREACAGYVAM